MAPYRYDAPLQEPVIGTIADIIQRGGLLRANAVQQSADAQAYLTAQRGAQWGNLASTLGNMPQQYQEQQRRDLLAQTDTAFKTQQIKESQAKLDEDTRQRTLRADATHALTQAIQNNRDPETGEVNAQAVVDAIEPQYPGFGQAWAESHLKTADAFNKLAASNREAKKNETLYLAYAARDAKTPAEFLARISTGRASNEVSARTSAALQQELETGDWTAIQPRLVKQGDEAVPADVLEEGKTLVSHVSRTPQISIPKTLKPTYTPLQVQYAKSHGHDEPTMDDILAVGAIEDQRKRADAISTQTAIHEANANADAARKASGTPAGDKYQSGLEKTYIAAIRSAMSRGNPVGQEDLKVRGANDLITVMNQFYNPKTGGYDIPEAQLNELALGLAKIIAPGGQAGVQMMNEFKVATAKRDTAKLWTYVTGKPQVASTPEQADLLRESIERIGKTSEQQREAQLDFLRALSPSDLEPERRDRLARAQLVPLYRTRVLQNPKTGERRLQTSIDGGKTWR